MTSHRIGIFSGSFKPPHRGHLQMVLDAIQKDRLTDVVIIISQKPRYLEEIVQYPEEFPKEAIAERFGLSLEGKGATKAALIKAANELKRSGSGKFPSITAEDSAKIWAEYLRAAPKEVGIDIRISHAFSPMINSDRYLQSAIRKDADGKNQYFLYKSSKDEKNTRFDFITTGSVGKAKGRVHIKVAKLIYPLNARDFRRAILAKKSISSFLPKGITSKKFYALIQ